MAGEVKMQGLPQLLENMRALPRELSSKNGGPVRRALFAAAKLIQGEAQARAPEDSGLLASEIRTVRDRDPRARGASERYMVGVRKAKRKRYGDTAENRRARRVGKSYQQEGRAYYWRFIEFGTEKMRAQPFLRPAFERRRTEALELFEKLLREGVQRVVRKFKRAQRR